MSLKNEKVLFTHTEDEILVESVARHPSIFDLKCELYKDQRVKENAWKEIEENVGRTAADCKKRWKNIRDTYRRRKKTKLPTGSAGGKKPEKWALQNMLSFLDAVDHKRASSANIDSQANDSDNEDVDGMSQDDDSQRDGLDEEYERATNHAESQSSEVGNEQKTEEDTIAPQPTLTPRKQKAPDTPTFRAPNKKQKLSDKIVTLMTKRSAERDQLLKDMKPKEEDSVDVFFRSLALTVKKFNPALIGEAKIRTLQIVNELELRNSSVLPPTVQIDSDAISSCLSSPIASCYSNNSPSSETGASPNNNYDNIFLLRNL